jgi:hypothetical protein
MPITRCGMLLAFFLALVSGLSFAQNNADHSSWSDFLVSWKVDCAPQRCLMHTEVLRGDSGSPANPRDSREYVSVNVALSRETRQPEYIAFNVDPRATQWQGIFIAFVHATSDGNSEKMVLDGEGAMNIPFATCGKLGCMARIPAGLEIQPSTGKRVNLLEKFLTSDAVMVLFTKDNGAYRTMILLSSFQKEYKHVMAVNLIPPQTPHAP